MHSSVAFFLLLTSCAPQKQIKNVFISSRVTKKKKITEQKKLAADKILVLAYLSVEFITNIVFLCAFVNFVHRLKTLSQFVFAHGLSRSLKHFPLEIKLNFCLSKKAISSPTPKQKFILDKSN